MSRKNLLTFRGAEEESRRIAARNAIWDRNEVRVRLADQDEIDPFEVMDLIGSRSPEARGGREAARNSETDSAPCSSCRIESCSGSFGECLLDTDPAKALSMDRRESDQEELPQRETAQGLKKPDETARENAEFQFKMLAFATNSALNSSNLPPEPIPSPRLAKAYVLLSVSNCRGTRANLRHRP